MVRMFGKALGNIGQRPVLIEQAEGKIAHLRPIWRYGGELDQGRDHVAGARNTGRRSVGGEFAISADRPFGQRKLPVGKTEDRSGGQESDAPQAPARGQPAYRSFETAIDRQKRAGVKRVSGMEVGKFMGDDCSQLAL